MFWHLVVGAQIVTRESLDAIDRMIFPPPNSSFVLAGCRTPMIEIPSGAILNQIIVEGIITRHNILYHSFHNIAVNVLGLCDNTKPSQWTPYYNDRWSYISQ